MLYDSSRVQFPQLVQIGLGVLISVELIQYAHTDEQTL